MAANNLRKVLANEGITQAQLARSSSVSDATVNRIYAGKRNPAPATKGKIVKGLNKLSQIKYAIRDIFPDYEE
jgi:predicted transcriptional regulator